MKKIVICICGLVLVILLFVYSSGDSKVVSYFVSQEKAFLDSGAVLFTIEYTYDSDGNEKTRTAYDGNGNQNNKWLDYAYDKRIAVTDYWRVEPKGEAIEGSVSGYHQIYKDYGFVYDSMGNLVTQWFYDDNYLGIEQIVFEYEKIKILKKDSK